jgi:hypothetical protein
MHGAIREPGYIFTLAEGELGPHRMVVAIGLSMSQGNAALFVCADCGLTRPETLEEARRKPRRRLISVLEIWKGWTTKAL